MAVPARLGLLVAAVSLMSLPSPHFQPAFWTAIALATVVTDADCGRRPAGRLRAKPRAQNSVPVSIHLSHSEIMSYDSNGGSALTACFVVPLTRWSASYLKSG